MAYGATRFLYDNFVTASSMLTPASQATGVVSGVEKTQGTDSGTMYATGNFSGTDNLTYTIVIDSVSGGYEVGQATFKWRTSETAGGAWEATGVATSTALTTLNYGVQVAFASGTGNDFALNDTFIFYAEAVYSPANLIDYDRNSLFRSGASFNIVIDLGSAQNVKAFGLLDHNLSSGTSTLTLEANSSDAWGAPPYQQAITITDPLLYYLDQTYRYWRVVSVDGTLSYIQIGELFLGDYLELSYNAVWDTPRTYGYTLQGERNPIGFLRRRIHAKQAELSLQYPQWLSNSDFEALVTMQEALIDLNAGTADPLWVHLFNDESDTIFFMDWMNIHNFTRRYFRNGLNSATLELSEQVKSRV